MSRLNNETRGQIVNAVIAHRFKAECDAIIEERGTIARMTYNATFKEPTRKAMEACPEGWLPRENRISVVVEGYDRGMVLRFNGEMSRWENNHRHYEIGMLADKQIEDVTFRFPYDQREDVVRPSQKVGDVIVEHLNRCDDLNDRITEARSKLAATIDEFYTIKKLLEAWPEVEPFIPAAEKPAPKVPALPTKALNEMFHLPS